MAKERWLNMLAVSVVTLFVFSLPFKLATVHVAGGLLLLTVFGLRLGDFRQGPMRTFAETSLAWLIPVLLAGIWHALENTPTAEPFSETVKVCARILGIGIGLIFLLQRGLVSIRMTVSSVMFAILLVAASGYFEWFSLWRNGVWPSWNGVRIAGAVFNPNPFGLFMALGMVISVGLVGARLCSRGVLLTALACIPLLWASGSRGSMIATVVGLLCFFSLKMRRYLWGLAGFAVAFVIAYGSGWLGLHRAHSDDTREALLYFAAMKWAEAPWVGWGIGSLTVLDGNILGHAAHNVLMDLGVSCGVFAVIGWLYGWGRMAFGVFRSDHPAARTVLAVLAVVLVSGCFDYSLLTATIYQGIWMLAAVLACWVASRQAGVPEGAK